MQAPLEFHGSIDPTVSIPNGARILVYSRDQSFLLHGVHKFPAKFFPELPRYLIQHYSRPGQRVLDPMCGSGTVVLEAMLANRIAIGIDIDPMAELISRVKTTVIDPVVLNSVREWILSAIDESQTNSNIDFPIPEFHYRNQWFKDYVLLELGMLKGLILSIPESVQNRSVVIEFLEVVFSSIIRDVSNADPHCTRTVIRKNLEKKISPGDTTVQFIDTLDRQIQAMNEFYSISQKIGLGAPTLSRHSALNLELEDNSIDLAVTSPPYINAVDYPRTHQLEMYWLGFIGDGPLADMKRTYIGTETVYKDEYQDLQSSGYDTLDPLLSNIYERDPRRSFIVYKFFQDMMIHLREMIRVLRPEAHYCLVIGNNTIRNVHIPSQDILAEIATSSEIGFTLEKQFFSGIIRHFIKIPRKERMPGEWVLILQKPS
jgi:DNA modification methylase